MTGCSGYAWTVRFAINLGLVDGGAYMPNLDDSGRHTETLEQSVWDQGSADLTSLFSLSSYPPGFQTSMHHIVKVVGPNYHLIVNSLFPTESDAQAAADNLELDGVNIFGVLIDEEADQDWAGYILSEPKVYTWRVATTSAGLQFNPTGLEVDNVEFDASGCATGCWRVDVTYTLGQDSWNVFYLPRTHSGTPAVDTLSFDFEYGQDVLDTFFPASFPCRTFDYQPDPNNLLPDKITACCIPEFYSKYRVLGVPGNSELWGPPALPAGTCTGGAGPPVYVAFDHKVNNTENRYKMPDHYVSGNADFDGMAGMVDTQLLDPFVNQWKATMVVDEKELRNKAGLLVGTVGVEYTIDTFIGLAEFKPTGQAVLDSFAKQINIHLEKTDLMTVATHGTNDYTFIEYINLRLIEVLNEDVVYSDDETESAFSRTLRYEAAHYLQVTFTMGDKYRPKDWADLIPLDSVRAGYGPFITQTVQPKGALHHSCLEYATPAGENLHFVDQQYKDLFHRRFPHCVDDLEAMTPSGAVPNFGECDDGTYPVQACAPNALMCANPEDTPDQFVIFNVPLGIDYLPAGSMFLDQKVHVQLVVQAYNVDDDPSEITKTTLTASVPVIPGGQNIFCDGIIGRADLADIARAVILIGSAHDEGELSRITIIGEDEERIANTKLDPKEPRKVSASSIESGLMTLVMIGNATYFDNPEQRNSFRSGLELEDLLTVHIMEADDRFDAPGTLSREVLELLREAGEENYNENNQLAVGGYRINGAFRMNINRAQQRAELDPTEACDGTVAGNATVPTCDGRIGLLWYCGWRLQASQGETVRSGCIIRRDWTDRGPNAQYPHGTEYQSAMELPYSSAYLPDTPDFDDLRAAHDAQYGAWRTDTGEFMASVLNSANYSLQLGRDFAKVIEDRYKLNGRSRRAWWINPAYTWVPSLTGGEPPFTLTQKVIMFALFNMNENYAYRTYEGLFERRRHQRRFLMQVGGSEQDTGDGLATIATSIIYETSMAQMLADAYAVPRRQVGNWIIGVQLKQSEACQPEDALVTWGRQMLTPLFEQTASSFWTVQVSEARVDQRDLDCASAEQAQQGLRREGDADAYTNAIVELNTIVVFKDAAPQLDVDRFVTFPGIYKLEELGESVVNREAPAGLAQTDDAGGSPSKAGMIGALVGGFAAVVLVGLAGYWYWARRGREGEEIQTATAAGLGDVKIELEADMARTGGFGGDVFGNNKGKGKGSFEDLLGGSGGGMDEFEPEHTRRSRNESPAPEF